MFLLTDKPLETLDLRTPLQDQRAGAYVAFEGWVRDHNDGRSVRSLQYEAYEALTISEADTLIEQTLDRFDVLRVCVVHRVGHLELGDMAVYVGVSSAHRQAAFAAGQFLMDQIKLRLAIWKKEFYADGTSKWTHCSGCGKHPVGQ